MQRKRNAATLVNEFASAIQELVAFYQARDRSVVCYYDISISECHALDIIENHGPMPLKDIVVRLQMDKSTTSRIVASLVKKGYALRRFDSGDGRKIRVSATAEGERLHAKIRLDLLEEYARLLQAYPRSFAKQLPGFIRAVTREAKRRSELT